MNPKFSVIILIAAIFFNSCSKEEIVDPGHGNIVFSFSHLINGSSFLTDTLLYTNEAGNLYEVNDLRYFISGVIFYGNNDKNVQLADLSGVHYIDIRMPATLFWNFPVRLPAGQYDSISFVFGMDESLNRSHAFVNPPEVNMAWPEILGGGYHYMMFNGKWVNPSSSLVSFNFHMGIGQIYSDTTHNTDSITSFVQNYFETHLYSSSFTVTKDKTDTIQIVMNVDSWFKTPHTWDFNHWGGMMMQNQDALNTARENGFDVFTIGYIR